MSGNGTTRTSFPSTAGDLSLSSLVPTTPSIAPASPTDSTPSSPNSPPPSTPSPSPPLTEPSASAPPESSPPPVSLPPSSNPAPSSNPPPPSSAPPPSSNEPNTPSSVVTAPSREPSTQIITSIITPEPTNSSDTPTPVIVTITSVVGPSGSSKTEGSPPTSTGTNGSFPGFSTENAEKSKGLSTGGKTAIAVVIPVVVVGLLVLAGIILWRKRKQRKNAEEDRRKEVEEYGYNPNNDPTLPTVGMASEMAEDQSGYRGWGNTTTSSNRKASTTLTSGMTYSDGGSNPGGYQSPNSPTHYSDGHSGDPLVNGRRETMDSEGISALGAAPNANQNQAAGVHRGPSNASSSYSAANRSDTSGDYPIPVNNPHDYYDNQGYYQNGPYGNDPYGGNQQPIIRDVSARRNTRIESPSVFPQQGNSGIAQNF